MLATLVGGTVAAGSANAINMYLDRDIDEIMRRTRSRPLPAHQVDARARARGSGSCWARSRSSSCRSTVNVLAATLALAAIAFYVFVYTMWLKRTTTQNIVIGGAAGRGARARRMGRGDRLARRCRRGSCSRSCSCGRRRTSGRCRCGSAATTRRRACRCCRWCKGEDETRRQIFLYSLVLFGTTLLLYPIGDMGPIYLATAIVLGGVFVYRALRAVARGRRRTARGASSRTRSSTSRRCSAPSRSTRSLRSAADRGHDAGRASTLVDQLRQLRRVGLRRRRPSGSCRRRRPRTCPAGPEEREVVRPCARLVHELGYGTSNSSTHARGLGGVVAVVDARRTRRHGPR